MNLLQYYKIMFLILYHKIYATPSHEIKKATKSIEQLILDYEDDKNAMIAIAEKENYDLYEDFYEEMDNRVRTEQSMNMIFFGPPISFMRLDPETVLHLIINTRKHLIPISKALLAWDIVTDPVTEQIQLFIDGKTAAYLQGREFLAFGMLLNVIPEEDLYYVNFGDSSVLNYFSSNSLNLHSRKYGVLVSAYRRYFGNEWFTNSSQINELGYMLCGFTSLDLRKIQPETFKELNVDVLSKLERCNTNQTKTLYSIATHPDAYGEPYKWSSHEIGRLNALFTCIPEQDISSIQLEAVPAISSKVMKSIHQRKLEFFTKQQILRMNPKARRVYILRMQLKNSLDMRHIKRNRSEQHYPVLTLYACFVTLVVKYKVIELLDNETLQKMTTSGG